MNPKSHPTSTWGGGKGGLPPTQQGVQGFVDLNKKLCSSTEIKSV